MALVSVSRSRLISAQLQAFLNNGSIFSARVRRHASREFYEVVAGLKNEVRETLQHYWKSMPGDAPYVYANLHMAQMLGHWAQWAGTIGFAFYFHEVLVTRAEDSIFHAAIAHELAEAFQMARDSVFLLDLRADPNRMEVHHRMAWTLAEGWGFDQAAAVRWCEKNIG